MNKKIIIIVGIIIIVALVAYFYVIQNGPSADSLTRSPSISGTLLDENDIPLPNYPIDSITDPNGNVVVENGVTDANGAFNFPTGDVEGLCVMNMTINGQPISMEIACGPNGPLYPFVYVSPPEAS